MTDAPPVGRPPVYTTEEIGMVAATSLSVHRATEVLLLTMTYPCWESVFQPTYAAYLNLIQPWWKTLRSLLLTRRCFAT